MFKLLTTQKSLETTPHARTTLFEVTQNVQTVPSVVKNNGTILRP